MPTITFSVNLEAPLRNSHSPVSNLRAEGDYFKNTRVSWFPGHILNNRKLKHGDTFTVSGHEAIYLRDNFTSGDYAFLDIESEGLVFSEAGESVA